MAEDYKKHFEEGVGKISQEDVFRAASSGSELFNVIQKSSLLAKQIKKLKLLWNMLKDFVDDRYKDVPWFTIASIAFVLLYVINPVDLIPDFIPLAGFADDVSVLFIAWNLVGEDLRKYCKWKATQDREFKEIYDELFA
ncbi:MAG: YkvA family protein [Thermodesulforhabdaceae bacterium]|jgi:uncharacterized membrane protein YkvA (DUF1232 family)